MAKHCDLDTFHLPVYEVLKDIRGVTGWNRVRMAQELGISVSCLQGYESGQRVIAVSFIENVREKTGIDPYMLAYCRYYKGEGQSERIQNLLRELREEWEQILMRSQKRFLPTSW